MRENYTADELSTRPTLRVEGMEGLKLDTGTLRVWLDRHTGRVTIEKLVDGMWVMTSRYQG